MNSAEQKAKKVPTIRFAGFEDEWVEKKLGDEAIELIAGGDIDKAKVVKKGKFPIYANALTNDGIVGYYDDFFRVKAPAVTITGRGEVGYAKARKENFTPVVRLLSVRSNHDSDFLENAINIHNVVVESTGVPQLTVPQISLYDIFFPCLFDEEKKLGSFFSNIDSLISLEQKKYDKLTQVKKSMLEKMFPKEGATVPEIRFAGFTGDWKERKLSQLVSYFSSNLTAKDVQENGIYDLYDANGVIGKINCSPRKKEYISVIKDGAGVGRIRKLPKNTLVIGTMGILESIDSDLNFVFAMLERFELGKQFTGSTIPHIYFKDYGEHLYVVPDYCEQQKIGSYFSHLDSLISLQQRKLEKLKNIKKSLLEKMFV